MMRRIFVSGTLRMFPYTSVLIRTNKAFEKITAVLCSIHQQFYQSETGLFREQGQLFTMGTTKNGNTLFHTDPPVDWIEKMLIKNVLKIFCQLTLYVEMGLLKRLLIHQPVQIFTENNSCLFHLHIH